MLFVVLFCFATAWRGIWGSNPAYWITLVLAAACSLGLLLWSLRVGAAPERTALRVRLSRALLVGLTVATGAALFYLRPLSATDVALDAMRSGDGVTVTESATQIHLLPTGPAKRTGLVFYPGAKVDPRAYAPVLRPLAEQGFTVVIMKQPYNLAVLAPGAADAVVGKDDDIDRWVVGGHSLGGTMAASYARTDRDELAGLLLYASYPAKSLADRTALDVVSIYGTEDGLATVADIDDSKVDLPPHTRFVPVDGAIHAYFGDYGTQSGDGTPTISRADAQRQILAATLAQLARVDAG
jgi:hypothetical protein